MALVAYSDDSDLGSETEDTEENGIISNNDNKLESVQREPKNIVSLTNPVLQNEVLPSSVDDIVEENDENGSILPGKSTLLASVPAALPIDFFEKGPGLGDSDDELTDVPTVDTWKVTTEIKKGITSENQQSLHQKEKHASSKVKERKKVKIFIPALSEFDDEEDEGEEEPEPVHKKVKPSEKGTGLFSVLPAPRHLSVKETKRSLVPHILTKTSHVKKASKPKPVVKAKPLHEDSESDTEKETGGTDFFSLSGSPYSSTKLDNLPTLTVPPSDANVSVKDVQRGSKSHENRVAFEDSRPEIYTDQTPSGDMTYQDQGESSVCMEGQEKAETINPNNLDQEAMVRLMGKRRGNAETINFIDINADDALLTRDEWMTKALTEEKPTHSFSSKKEGLPSQKQKQKHQITYLAHQAKERELELKNSWAQNRMTKMQTQAKYGF
ncbi:hypothetical protein SK128_016124 [Halocaridina rubra]|uniref:Proline-rich protein PRCC n=1 Tax=Halocaridina rubra TaxID=373956 RepID=A0AAN9A2B3_HALRR